MNATINIAKPPFKIIVGMRFVDSKRRSFLVTDVFYRNPEVKGLAFTVTTTDGYKLHFCGPTEGEELYQIGFIQEGKEGAEMIIRDVAQIYEWERKNTLKFID